MSLIPVKARLQVIFLRSMEVLREHQEHEREWGLAHRKRPSLTLDNVKGWSGESLGV
jgi:hypothetical protein